MSSASSRSMRALVCAGAAIVAAAAIAAIALRHRSMTAAALPVHLEAPRVVETPPPPDPSVLRVCADPNNLPFTNERGEGFENAIARIVARDLGRRLEYYWAPQRRGFIRTTLKAGYCDVVLGVPARFEMARPTQPYYRSTYVFVSRRGQRPRLSSLDDPRLKQFRIGVEMTGEDYENPPAVQALAARHIIDNVRGYLVYGDYSTPNPPRRVIDAVSSGQVDTAIAWGPLAGYFAKQSTVPLEVTPVGPHRDGPALPFEFDIAMGVRRGDNALHDALDRVLARRAAQIRQILERFGVPLLGQP
jgi:mxaJ protein